MALGVLDESSDRRCLQMIYDTLVVDITAFRYNERDVEYSYIIYFLCCHSQIMPWSDK